MARARNIKPAIFRNEILGVADPLYTLLFQSLWLLADREGRLEDRPIRIKADTFPYREGVNVDAMLTWLHDNGFIIRYGSGKNPSDSRFIQIVSFLKHQNPHRNEAESIIPAQSAPCKESRKNPSDSGNYASASEEIGSAPADSLNLIPDSLNLIPDSGYRTAEGDERPAATSDGQDYIDRITKHDRANQSVTMTTEWKPSEQFPALMMRAGIPLTQLTDELLAKFVIHHNGSSRPQNKWEASLVMWCKTERASTSATSQQSGYGRYVEQPMNYPMAEPDKEAYTGPVDTKAAAEALAAMRAGLKQDGEAF